MSDREELMALRRMAELEAKASGSQTAVQPASTVAEKESGFFGGLGNLVAGGLRGASSIGSTIVAPFEAALAGTGQTGAKAARKERLERVESGLQGMGADTESLPYQGGKIAAEIAGTAGVGPTTPATSFLGRVAQGVVTGGSAASVVDPESTAEGAAWGAVIPVVSPILQKGGALVANATGPMRESWRTSQGRKFLDEMLGPDQAKAKVIQAIATRNPSRVTTVADDIAAANVGRTDKFGSPLVSIENELAGQPHGLSDIAKSVAAQQEAGRMAALEFAKPDLAQAIAARSAIADPLYKASRAAGNVADPSQVVIKINDLLQRNAANPRLVKELSKIKSGLFDETGNLRIDAEQVSSAIDGVRAAMGNQKNKFILGILDDLKADLTKSVPGREVADKAFAKASEPVNQSKVIQAMQDVLSGQGGPERVTPFMNVLGRGEQAMLKRTTGFPRYEAGDLPNVLTGQGQMDAVNRVTSELTRDLERKSLGQSVDTKHLFEIAEKGKGTVSIPTLLSRPAMLANFVMKKIGKGADEMITEDMGRLMLSDPAAFSAKYLQDIPASQRQVVIDELMKNFINPVARVAAPVMSAQ